MMTVSVRLDGPGAMPMPERILKTVYVSGPDFDPEERRMRITPDGTVELQVTKTPYIVHARIQVPLYGQRWVTADNLGAGYTGTFVDFVSEAVRTYIAHAARLSEGVELSVQTRAHFDAASELQHLADRGKDTPDNRLYALSHAILAAEGALVERARQKIFSHPRKDLMLGCNFTRFSSPSSRYAGFFAKAFDYATLPFYPGRTVPQKGVYDYRDIDQALAFLSEKHITPKGHPLFFGHREVNPSWLFGLPYAELSPGGL